TFIFALSTLFATSQNAVLAFPTSSFFVLSRLFAAPTSFILVLSRKNAKIIRCDNSEAKIKYVYTSVGFCLFGYFDV
ncbi:hypothetical protein, partial [Alistipes sp. ZOR0009]|uniref:hypothetical protein n=1 Tax=Alistipes sp. ZOR0009 TaxID=1339253 RepID=UPI001E62DF6B